MIRVDFAYVQPGEDINASVSAWAEVMPWLKYLVDNNTGFEYDESYHPVSRQNLVKLRFTLPPEKETFYCLRYR